MEKAGLPRLILFSKLSGLVAQMRGCRSRNKRRLGRFNRWNLGNYRSVNSRQALAVIAAVIRSLHVVAASIATAIVVAATVRVATIALTIALTIAAAVSAAVSAIVVALAVGEGFTVETHIESGIDVSPEALESLR